MSQDLPGRYYSKNKERIKNNGSWKVSKSFFRREKQKAEIWLQKIEKYLRK